MSDLLQQAVVGLAATGAAVVILRRVIRAFRPPAVPSACEHCALPTLPNSQDSRRADR